VIVIGHGGETGSGDSAIDRDTITSLSNNVMSATNLLHSQSDFIKNLGNQLTTLQGAINLQNERITNETVTSQAHYTAVKNTQQNMTKLVNAVVVMWSQSEKNYVQIIKDIRRKIKDDNDVAAQVNAKWENRFKNLEKKLEIMEIGTNNARRLAASKRSREGWPRGRYCILANGACPIGFRKQKGFLKGIYVYGTSRHYVKSTSFGNSYIGCYGQCNNYGSNYATINMETCCK
ncbi:hypothetical protein QZH41_008122, partial [Actinostola sp. cb2023]